MERFNEACDFVSVAAFRIKSANKMLPQKEAYYEIRDRFALSAQLAVRAIAKACEAYKRDNTRRPKFNKHGAVVYDQRILSWKARIASR
jgi:predicted transposase